MSTIAAFYAHDHRRLDELWSHYRSSKPEDAALAADVFDAFKGGLERHIAWEEALLFPFFETKTGMRETGPTAVMRFEHEQIRACLDVLERQIQGGSPALDSDETHVADLLAAHNWKEEAILYPLIDEQASAEEKAQLFQQMDEPVNGICTQS